jgi:hypothetical protein
MFTRPRIAVLGTAGLILLAVLTYRIPAVESLVDWRIFRITTYFNGVVHPVGAVPTALVDPTNQTSATIPASLATPIVLTPAPRIEVASTSTGAPLPQQVSLPAPAFEDEKKFPNNCGPATLTMALRMVGWSGDQFAISDVIKPQKEDRNVNPDELVWWVRNNPGGLGLKAETRVNGNISLLKQLLAAGYPVIIEETFIFDSAYWPNDDLWAAHYVLLTGYDDAKKDFIVQDAFHGPNLTVSYDKLQQDWEPFNHLYLIVYLADQEQGLRNILGANWDVNLNRQNALTDTQAATVSFPNDAYAWYNYGSNLVYFDRYEEAVSAYNAARKIGLHQRMMRYSFGPFLADFYTNRFADLLVITQDTLDKAESNGKKWSEEAWLWKGWGLFGLGKTSDAINAWNIAIDLHPKYCDAENAIAFVQRTKPPSFCVP